MIDEDPRTQLYRNRKTGDLFTAFAGNAYMLNVPGPRTFVVLRRMMDGCMFIVASDEFMGRRGPFEIVSKEDLAIMSAIGRNGQKEANHEQK